ncbi:S8 family serine peptidase [Aeromicrobium yanjiei]|uniref:S8 family serine peptidase n=1 Tax=Aeromicrobium yanjiei TaxID=2662028 RepID=A0A5Q2MLP9_9ACTN|nr:S8 family serine peptidase [Aeromicrobium yanjiei]
MTIRGRGGAAVAAALVLLTLATPPASAKPLEPWWFTSLSVASNHEQSTGKGVKIAVIDGALNRDIPELDGAKVKLRAALAPGLKSGLIKPRSFSREFYASHGTAMTTLIVGQGKGNAPGGAGITGMAPDAEVYFYQMDPDPTDPETPYPGELFEQAIKDKVDIISYSFTNSTMLEPQIEAAQAAGIVVVAGAGNPNAAVTEPASLPGVVAVGVLDKKIRPWKKQPEGNITIIAPGVDIASGAMKGTATQARWVSGVERTGTSDATPLVAGALALVKSKYPHATGNQLIQQLIHSAGGRDYGYSMEGGFGVISLEELLARDPAGWPDENPLLKGPNYAFDTYPQSAWKDPDAPTPKPTPADTNDKPAADQSAQPAAEDESSSPLPWIIGAAVLVALLVVAAAMARRRRGVSSALTTKTGGTSDGTQ